MIERKKGRNGVAAGLEGNGVRLWGTLPTKQSRGPASLPALLVPGMKQFRRPCGEPRNTPARLMLETQPHTPGAIKMAHRTIDKILMA